jgi:hypothetical protein
MDHNSLSRYISTIAQYYQKKPALDYTSLNILEQFAWDKFLSAYNIYTKFRSPSERFYRKMAYKNVNKRVHELCLLGLIEEINSESGLNKHKAKYYRLTEYGIYRLFLNKLSSIVVNQFKLRESHYLTINMLTFFNNYQTSILFELFIYPYFEIRTLFTIWNYLFFDIYGYLSECCSKIEPKLKNNIFQTGELMFSLGKEVALDEHDKKNLLDYLKSKFNINVDDILHIERTGDNNVITIYAASTILTLDKSKKEVTIFSTASGEPEQFKYGLYPAGPKILAMDKKAFEESLKDILDNSRNEMEEIVYGLVYTLAHIDPERSKELSYYSKVLAEDKKFMETVERIYSDKHKSFEQGYKILRNI